MKKILVTGSSGYIGSILVSQLLQAGYYVNAVDSMLPHFSGAEENFHFFQEDVCNLRTITPLIEKSDIIIPLAGIIGIDACAAQPTLAKKINVEAIEHLAKTINKEQLIIYPSSSSVYGLEDSELHEYTEESTLNPKSLYAKTNAISETLLHKHENKIILRICAAFGYSPKMRSELTINKFVLHALNSQQINIEHDFANTYIHIKDISNAILFCIDNFHLTKGHIFNLGASNINLTKKQLYDRIQALVPSANVSTFPYQTTLGGIVNCNKIEKLGWKTQISLESGIHELMDFC